MREVEELKQLKEESENRGFDLQPAIIEDATGKSSFWSNMYSGIGLIAIFNLCCMLSWIVSPLTEERGFDLSPAHTGIINGILASQNNAEEGYDLSPEDEVRLHFTILVY